MTLASQNKVPLPKAGQFFQLTYVCFLPRRPIFCCLASLSECCNIYCNILFVNDFQQEITFVLASYYHDGRNCSRPIQNKKNVDKQSEKFVDAQIYFNRNDFEYLGFSDASKFRGTTQSLQLSINEGIKVHPMNLMDCVERRIRIAMGLINYEGVFLHICMPLPFDKILI